MFSWVLSLKIPPEFLLQMFSHSEFIKLAAADTTKSGRTVTTILKRLSSTSWSRITLYSTFSEVHRLSILTWHHFGSSQGSKTFFHLHKKNSICYKLDFIAQVHKKIYILIRLKLY